MGSRTTMAVLGAAVMVASVNLAAPAAGAATLPIGAHIKVSMSSTTLRITDASKGRPIDGDFDNGIDVKVKRDEGVAYIQDDQGTAIAGAGCSQGSFNEDVSHNRPEDVWAAGWGPWQVKCVLPPRFKQVSVNAGPGDDLVNVLLSPVPVSITGAAGNDDLEYWSLDGDQSPPPYWSTSTINGGLGDDYLVGGRGHDVINGARGYDWVEGTCGEDTLNGGGDDDQILAADALWGNMDCPYSKDTINCGDGGDGVDRDPSDVVNVNCEDVAGPY